MTGGRDLSRRSVLEALVAVLGIATVPPGLAENAQAAHAAARWRGEGTLSFPGAAEAADVEAVTAHIIPTDDAVEQRRIESGQPDDSVRLGGAWNRKQLGLTASIARCGTFCSFTLNPADDQEYSAKWLTDNETSYRNAGYPLALTAQNVFDVFPDRNSTISSFNGIQTFPSRSPVGMNGRTIYARIGRRYR